MQSQKMFIGALFFSYLAISSCSNNHDQQIAENINLEFELTYRYVATNMAIEINYSDSFSSMQKNNKDAFTSIAYTWHKISLEECDLSDNSSYKSNKTGYERITNQSPPDNNLSKKIIKNERPCLAEVYFSNWASIQNMLLLSYPNLK
ncbi:MAG: hypothetical protein AB8B89_03930 [Gammaproteobacteria bacterium]